MNRKTVRVWNYEKETWVLVLGLEAKSNNGGKTATVVEGSDFVDVEFEDEQVAQRFLKQGNITINGMKYDITSLNDEITYLLITRLSELVTSEAVVQYLNEQIGISKNATNILDFNSTEGYAICSIKDCNGLHAILENKRHTICGSDVKFFPMPKDLTDLKKLSCGIKVKMPYLVDEFRIQIIFEKQNHRIEELYINEAEKTATITYENPRGMQEHCDIKYCDGIPFEVEQMIPKFSIPSHHDMLSNNYIVTNLPLIFEKGMLSNYFKKYLKNGDISEVFFARKKPGAVLISFILDLDFHSILRVLYSKPFCDKMLGIEQVQKSHSIQIFNTSDISPEALKNYFETFCGQQIIGHFFGDDFAKLTFGNPLSPEKMIGKEHILDGKKLHVSIYYENFGIVYPNDLDCKCWSEKFFSVMCESLFVNFFMQSDKHRQLIDEELKRFCGIIEWPNTLQGFKHLVELRIKFDQKLNSSFCIEKLNTWQHDCEQAFDKLKQSFSVHETNISNDHFSNIVNRLLVELKEPKSTTKLESGELHLFDDVMICIGHGVLTFSGYNSRIEGIVALLEKIKCQEEEKLQVVVKNVSLNPWQMDYVRKNKILEIFNIVFEFDVSNGCIKIECPKGVDDSAVEMEIWKLLAGCNNTKLNCESYIVELLNDREISEHVNNLLEENKLNVCLNISSTELFICSPNSEADQVCNKVLSVLMSILTQKEIQLDENSRSTFSKPEWKNKVEKLFKYPLVKIAINDSVINIKGISDSVNAVEESINSYFDENAVYECSIPISKGIHHFIEEYRSSEIKRFGEEFEGNCGILKLEKKLDRWYFYLKGTKSILKTMEKKIKKLLEAIKTFKRIISKVEFSSYMESQEGKLLLDSISINTETVIEIFDPETEDRNDAKSVISGNRKYATVQISKNCSVNVVFGSILDCETEVIVNAANGRLNHIGGVAKVISMKAGPEMQKECSCHVERFGELQVGEVFVSHSGSLKFKSIIHAVGPTYNRDKQNNLELYKVVETILKTAVDKKWNKIALPAISTGVYGFPLPIAIPIIFDCIKNFAKESQHFIVIEIVDVKDKVIAECLKIIKEKFNKKEILFLKEISLQRTEAIKIEKSKVGNPSPKDKNPSPKRNRLQFVIGSLVDQSVDVVVNSAASDLNLKQGTIAQVISNQAGPEMQKACTEYNTRNGSLGYGDIFISQGFSLPCQFVFHGTCSAWNPGNKNSEMSIRLLTTNSLEEASKRNLKSIAMPSFGTGRLNVPATLVARWMAEETDNFFNNNPNSSLVDVRLVVYKDDHKVIKEMEEFFNGKMPSAGKVRNERKLKQNKIIAGSVKESELTFEISKLVLEVCMGDLTDETTNAIVNNTNDLLDFSKCNIAKAIFEKGGSIIKDECRKYGNKDAIAVTSGGSLGCAQIFHVVAKQAPVMKECLSKAEELKLKSLSFPLLTKKGMHKTSEIAKSMLEELVKFAEESKINYLRKVRIVIHDESAMREIKDFLKSQTGGVLSKFRKAFEGTSEPAFQFHEHKSRPGPTNLRIFAATEEKADEVVAELERALSGTIYETPIKDPVIGQLDNDEIAEIIRFQNIGGINIHIDKVANTINLKGMKLVTSKVQSSIFDILKFAHERIRNSDYVKRISQQIQWYFKDLDYQKYPEEINAIIEKAFVAKQEKVSWTEEIGKYEINFDKMVEICISKPDSSLVVKRISKYETCPLYWDVTPDQVKVFEVSPNSEEFKKVERNVRQSAGTNVISISKIERIQNGPLHRQYLIKKEEIRRENQHQANISIEQTLWHIVGPQDVINDINNNGFNRSKDIKPSRAADLGQGCYFFNSFEAVSQPQPSAGVRCAYQCQVLTGRYMKGVPKVRDIPLVAGQKSNSMVDNTTSPTTYAIFNDFQAYPEYLVYY